MFKIITMYSYDPHQRNQEVTTEFEFQEFQEIM